MAMERSFPIIQIVGFQNSGKTTLMEKLISTATEEGLNVAAFKHHGHGGMIEDKMKKDSAKHQRAGAVLVGVEGNGMLQIQAKRKKWALKKIIDLYHFFNPDVLFIEGYKQEHYPKVVMIREKGDWENLQSLTNIICVLSWNTFTFKKCSFPIFHINEQEEYIKLIIEKIKTAHFH